MACHHVNSRIMHHEVHKLSQLSCFLPVPVLQRIAVFSDCKWTTND